MWKDVFKFEILITDEPMKNQSGRQHMKMVPTQLKYNKFYLRHPKIQVESCSFYWLDIFLMFVIIDIET